MTFFLMNFLSVHTLLQLNGKNLEICTNLFDLYKGGPKSSYNIFAVDDFWPMRLKHFNTNGRSVRTTKSTVEK